MAFASTDDADYLAKHAAPQNSTDALRKEIEVDVPIPKCPMQKLATRFKDIRPWLLEHHAAAHKDYQYTTFLGPPKRYIKEGISGLSYQRLSPCIDELDCGVGDSTSPGMSPLADREQTKKEDEEWMRTKLGPKDEDWVNAASPAFSPSQGTAAETRKRRSAEKEELDSQKTTDTPLTNNSQKKMGYSSDSMSERDSKRQRTDDRPRKQRTFQADDWMAAGKKYKDLAQELSKDKQGHAPALCALYYAASALSYLRSMVDNEVSAACVFQ